MTRGGHSLFSFRSGENSSEPGAESVATLETDGQFVNENGVLRLELTLEADFSYDPEVHYSNEPFWVFVEDVDGESFIYSEFVLFNTRHDVFYFLTF